MKASYPGEERPLRHFPELTGRLTAGVERLVRQGIPYLEAGRVSNPAVQARLEPLYAARPRAGSVVAIVPEQLQLPPTKAHDLAMIRGSGAACSSLGLPGREARSRRRG